MDINKNLLIFSSVLDASTISAPSATGLSTSFGSPYGAQRRSGLNIGNQYPLMGTGNLTYELGTSFTEDEQSKAVSDENNVIALVTGEFLLDCQQVCRVLTLLCSIALLTWSLISLEANV